MKPYAFIQFESNGYDGIERVSRLIVKHGLNPEDFHFQEFDRLPSWLRDSFSIRFVRSAARLGEGVIVTVAQQK